MEKISVGIIGSGNIAWSLGEILKKHFSITYIHSRNLIEAKRLSVKLKTACIKKSEIALQNTDILFVCLSDDVLSTYLTGINFKKTIILHTSGSANMNLLANYSKNIGVFYPVQTINKIEKTDWRNVPICIEASNSKTKKIIDEIAKQISDRVYYLNSSKRTKLHLAAVFANNFSNACFSFADEILEKEKIPFEIIKPLIAATASNVMLRKPSEVQTGPAKRGDLKTIKKHIALLENDKALQSIYKLITKRISKA
jgi:predicted short-subunit dehydrogenase-like oxidoreductase (DUF2520 family)